MASEAVVSFVVGKLGELLIEEALLLHGVKDQFEWINCELKRMQCFLKDADAKQKTDERVKNWVAEIRDVAYDAEDVIETFIFHQAKSRRHGLVGLVTRFNSMIFTEPITRHKVGKEIQRIKSKISDISNSRETYGITDINEGGKETSSSIPTDMQERRRLSALFEESDVVGLQEDMNAVKKLLFNGEPRRHVVSIVGMGGLGKTTLARKVYRDVKQNFDCHAFICLSQQYAIREVLTRIIQCVMTLSDKEMRQSNEVLVKKLSDYLREKKYLVVIDDIWTMEAWNDLKLMLPVDSSKSRVILTTRNKEVALHADPLNPPHEMRFLKDDEGWELFLRRAFQQPKTPIVCPPDLEKIGRQILAKCHGLPLAIVVLGGLLSRRDKTLTAWSRVLDSVNWHLGESSDRCRDILALSYYSLPLYLKPCFLYFGMFPEDSQIPCKTLIQLWIAEGFIQLRGNEIIEDVAEDYLEELIGRSMIQVARKRSNGSVSKCRIHDLLRDLAISEAKLNNFFTTLSNKETVSSSTRSPRRLVLSTDNYEIKNLSIATLRSMLCFCQLTIASRRLICTGSKLLRVMDLNLGTERGEQKFSIRQWRSMTGRRFKLSPKGTGELLHLRYLYIPDPFNECHSLSFIGKLSNIQTLKIEASDILPNEIWYLEHLRHLHAFYCEIEGHPRLNNLTNLQTLCLKAGSWIGDGLGRMTNLKKLGINVSPHCQQETLSESIVKLHNLRSFKIMRVTPDPLMLLPFTQHLHLYKMYLRGNISRLPEFSPNLSKLTLYLYYSKLGQNAIAMLEKLPHLRILRLLGESYGDKKMTCSSGGFPQLKFFQFKAHDLEEWILEEGAMPSLESAIIYGCHHLKAPSERVRQLLESFQQNLRYL